MKNQWNKKLLGIIGSYLIALPLIFGARYGSRLAFYYNNYKDKTLFAGDCVPMVLSNMNKEKFDYSGIFSANETLTFIYLQNRRYFPYENVVFIPSSCYRMKSLVNEDKYINAMERKLKRMFPFSKIIVPSNKLLREGLEKYPIKGKIESGHLTKEGHIWLMKQDEFNGTGILEDILEGKSKGLNKDLI